MRKTDFYRIWVVGEKDYIRSAIFTFANFSLEAAKQRVDDLLDTEFSVFPSTCLEIHRFDRRGKFVEVVI